MAAWPAMNNSNCCQRGEVRSRSRRSRRSRAGPKQQPGMLGGYHDGIVVGRRLRHQQGYGGHKRQQERGLRGHQS